VMAGYDLERDARFDRCLKPFRPGSYQSGLAQTGQPAFSQAGLLKHALGRAERHRRALSRSRIGIVASGNGSAKSTASGRFAAPLSSALCSL